MSFTLASAGSRPTAPTGTPISADPVPGTPPTPAVTPLAEADTEVDVETRWVSSAQGSVYASYSSGMAYGMVGGRFEVHYEDWGPPPYGSSGSKWRSSDAPQEHEGSPPALSGLEWKKGVAAATQITYPDTTDGPVSGMPEGSSGTEWPAWTSLPGVIRFFGGWYGRSSGRSEQTTAEVRLKRKSGTGSVRRTFIAVTEEDGVVKSSELVPLHTGSGDASAPYSLTVMASAPGKSATKRLLPIEIDQQNYNAADGIRFCRWLDAFPNEQFDNQAADKDRDRFRIKIAGNIPNLTKAKIKATDLHGAVIDGQFVNKTTDGDYEVEMKAEGGSMVSTPILLVSDGDDDKKYNGKGTDDGNDDQTLLADFDSKIVVTFPELGNAQAEFKASKAKGEIKLNAFFLSLDGSLPADKRTAIELHLRKAREIYRQSGTKVTITNISPFTLPSIWATYLGERKNSNGEVVEQANVISYQERTLLINELRSQTDHPIPSGQMLITFIDATIQSGGTGGTGGFTADDFAPPCVISLTGRFANFHISAAHESGHMLGVRHPVEGQAIPPRLMTSSSAYVGPRYNWNHLDSKRLIESELATMKAAGGFYVQLP